MNRKFLSIALVLSLCLSIFLAAARAEGPTNGTGHALGSYTAPGIRTAVNDTDNDEEASEHWSLSYHFIVRDGSDGQLLTTTSCEDDLSYLAYTEHTNFTVTVQINYRNTNQIMDYNAGELTISVPNLMYGRSAAQVEYNNISFGVSTDETGAYSWKLVNEGSDYLSMPDFVFRNERAVKMNENFEGSIQIIYTMASLAEVLSGSGPQVEVGQDSCLHQFTSTDRATLQTYAETIRSNAITYTYTRKYVHTFKDAKYSIRKKGISPVSADGILSEGPENFKDYYWVRWNLTISVGKGEMWRYATRLTLADDFPDGCIVYGSDGRRLSRTTFKGQPFYTMEVNPPEPGESIVEYFLVGYPKANYTADALQVDNTAYVYAKMQGKESEGFVYHDDDSDSVNLGGFDFQYDTGYYAIGKEATSEDTKYFQSITGTDPELNLPFTYNVIPIALYTGFPMDVLVGDDMLYIHSKEGKYRRLEDSEYYFCEIQFPGKMYDGNGNLITTPYAFDLYVRRAGTDFMDGLDAYELSAAGTYTPNSTQTFRFTRDDAKKTAAQGTIYNFDWINVFNQEGVLQNEVDEDSYINANGAVTRDMLAKQDRDSYGHYMQRDADYDLYETMTYPDARYIMYAQKSMTSSPFDDELMGWPMHANLKLLNVALKITDAQSKYLSAMPEDKMFLGWDYVEILPDYTELISTPEEIVNSFRLTNTITGTKFYCFEPDGSFRSIGQAELERLARENATVELTEIGGQRCLRVIFDLSEHPLVISGYWWTGGTSNVSVSFETNISFDFIYSYEGYLSDKLKGRTVDNEFLGYYHGRQGKFEYGYRNTFNYVYANGYVKTENVDHNGNGVAPEFMVFGDAKLNVGLPSSSYINIIKEVADDDDETEFTPDHVDVEYGAPYFYRLSIVTGQNKLTNVTLYEYLEEYTKDPDGTIVAPSGRRDFWTGSFVSLDMSNVLGKSYIDNVDVYYSSKDMTDHTLYIDADGNDVPVNDEKAVAAGSRLNTAEWTKYEKGVTDPNLVRSLAFDFKNKNGVYATIPENEKLFIVIEMKAPEDKEYYTYAYNGVWTGWTALGSHFTDDTIPGVSGINSNIVTVALPHAGQTAVNVEIEKSQAIVVGQDCGKPTTDELEVREGDIVRYFITVTNTGNSVAKDIWVTDEIPQGLELVEGSVSHNGTVKDRVIMWTIDTLDYTAGNNTKTFTFDVRVPEDTDRTHWVNQARVTYDDDDDPDNPRENKPSNEVEIGRLSYLTIKKQVEGDVPGTGSKTFVFTVTGPADVAGNTYDMEGGGRVTFDEEGSAEVRIIGSGSATIKGLPAGTYTVTEDELDAAVAGYSLTVVISEHGRVTVTGGANTTVTVTNTYTQDELPDVPKTGDDSRIALWTALTLLSASVLFAAGNNRPHRKRKKA